MTALPRRSSSHMASLRIAGWPRYDTGCTQLVGVRTGSASGTSAHRRRYLASAAAMVWGNILVLSTGQVRSCLTCAPVCAMHSVHVRVTAENDISSIRHGACRREMCRASRQARRCPGSSTAGAMAADVDMEAGKGLRCGGDRFLPGGEGFGQRDDIAFGQHPDVPSAVVFAHDQDKRGPRRSGIGHHEADIHTILRAGAYGRGTQAGPVHGNPAGKKGLARGQPFPLQATTTR
ncbi:hypothetical protein C7415_108235 [Cupriavidus alkaliphilus]|nr:hypothetical protein C7415_108235 [Cupriavidus alkaliphilus]